MYQKTKKQNNNRHIQLMSLGNVQVHKNAESTAGADRKLALAKQKQLFDFNEDELSSNKEEAARNVLLCTVETTTSACYVRFASSDTPQREATAFPSRQQPRC